MPDDPPHAGPCPICGTPAQPAFRPFCSDRCRMRDLAHWVGGDEPYVIPGPPLAPTGATLTEEDQALLQEAMAEGSTGTDAGNVIRADFRARRRRDNDEA
ncbi:MAG: DNA gyrase inhibitor YacG [Rhodospirillales bacterium]|nr:DNA gyrase inhibitor YacG [Rhodospirillales bacterium]